MKKALSIILALAITIMFASCSAKQRDSESSTNSTSSAAASAQSSEESSAASTAKKTNGQKILVVYFSAANRNSDAESSATPYYDGYGATEYLAQHIHEKVGGDIEKITPKKDYPTSYQDTADQAKEENDKDQRPEFNALSVNPEDYDVIFVGYPMWWYTLPMVMYTFFDTYDFSGKTIIPFNTHEGSGDGGTYDTIKKFEPKATVLDGFNVNGGSADSADSDLDKWLAGLKY